MSILGSPKLEKVDLRKFLYVYTQLNLQYLLIRWKSTTFVGQKALKNKFIIL